MVSTPFVADSGAKIIELEYADGWKIRKLTTETNPTIGQFKTLASK